MQEHTLSLTRAMAFRLEPHIPGSFVRIMHGRDPGHKYPNRPLVNLDGGATCFCCEYCSGNSWARGTWRVQHYRMHRRTGWWEYDDGACFCVYFDRGRHEVKPGDEFFHKSYEDGSLLVLTCDYATPHGIVDLDAMQNHWKGVIVVRAFGGLKRAIARWRDSYPFKKIDCVGPFLEMKDWLRWRHTVASDYVCFLNFARKHHARCLAWISAMLNLPWQRVTRSYTRHMQVLNDEINVDTITYVAIGARVLQAMGMAPNGINSAGWLYAMIETTSGVDYGWIHPQIVGSIWCGQWMRHACFLTARDM